MKKRKAITHQVDAVVNHVFIVFDDVFGNIDSVWFNKQKAQRALKKAKNFHKGYTGADRAHWIIKEFEIKG